MIICITSMKIKPGMRDTYIRAASICAKETHKETGCIQYDHVLSAEDPDGVLVVEQWEAMEYAFAHMETEHFKSLTKISNEVTASFTVKLFDATPSHALDHIFPTH